MSKDKFHFIANGCFNRPQINGFEYWIKKLKKDHDIKYVIVGSEIFSTLLISGFCKNLNIDRSEMELQTSKDTYVKIIKEKDDPDPLKFHIEYIF